MANPYFNNLPDFLYVNRTKDGRSEGDYSIVKNLFKRAKLRTDIFQDTSFFNKYIVEGDDRPDNVAEKVYGDSTLDWLVLMANNVVNVQSEWPMSQADFYTYVTEKYDSETTLYSGIHHYKSREVKTTDGSVIIQSGEKVGVGQSVSYYDYGLGQHVRATDVAIPVTNFEYEDNLNNKKREIYILKQEYLNIVTDDLDEIMRYKKGSTQFLSETLVRGDDIRLTN
tara:strand:+ start:1578 stop:2252 length:675 start_codon:yes stop_codon:yes gene_type:complete